MAESSATELNPSTDSKAARAKADEVSISSASRKGLKKVPEFDVLIAGGGFSGVYCARMLGRYFRWNSDVHIGLVSNRNYMVYQPMLPEVAGGTVSPRHVANPLRLLCPGVKIFTGDINHIDLDNQKVRVNAGPFTGDVEIKYKELVLGLGAEIDLKNIPGMTEHGLILGNIGDAVHLRSTIISRIEEANLEPDPEIKNRLLSFVVVGGGYSGVETAGQILDLFRSIHIYYSNVTWSDFRVVLIHSRDHLLPTLSRKLGDYCAECLQKRGLQIMFNSRVKAVTASRVYLNDGQSIETHTVVCTVGNAPHSQLNKLSESHDLTRRNGRLVTDEFCRVGGTQNLWAAGDCAQVPFVRGGFCPDTAQFAMRHGKRIAENIRNKWKGRELKPFDFEGYGELASIGHHSAVADILGFKFSGFFAWWLWRTIYLFKLPRLDRKIRVVVDWTLDLFFPRDINLLNPRYTTPLRRMHLEKGDVLFRKGDPVFAHYAVRSGEIEIRDENRTAFRIDSETAFTDEDLRDNGQWKYDAVAGEAADVVSIPRSIFDELGFRSRKRLKRVVHEADEDEITSNER